MQNVLHCPPFVVETNRRCDRNRRFLLNRKNYFVMENQVLWIFDDSMMMMMRMAVYEYHTMLFGLQSRSTFLTAFLLVADALFFLAFSGFRRADLLPAPGKKVGKEEERGKKGEEEKGVITEPKFSFLALVEEGEGEIPEEGIFLARPGKKS